MAKQPNILFFHIDNISQGDLGCYGGGFPLGAKTPNIDRFAKDSLQLTNYNVEAQCTPTRSALMTGRHSVRTGCTTVMGGGIVGWEITMAEPLKELGYRNAIYGKWHMGKEAGRYPTDHGFDYWYGIEQSWNDSMWPDDKFFKETDFKPHYMIESTGPGDRTEVKPLNREVRRNVDLEFLEKAKGWMDDSVAADEPFFVYFNHSYMHYPLWPREEYLDSSQGGFAADCLQQIDGDFQVLMDKLDELGVADNTIVIVAGDNGRDTTFVEKNERDAQGNFRGGYFSTYEGNNRTVCMARWPGHITPGVTDEMMHVVDWFPTLMNLLDHEEKVPTDRVLDGVDQSDFILGEQDESNREHFFMFFMDTIVGFRWRNFKILTHRVRDGAAPIENLASPHIYNLTVNPDEDTPYNYDQEHAWVTYYVYQPKLAELNESLKRDSVPFGAPNDYVPVQDTKG